MDSPQYMRSLMMLRQKTISFKPYYKWIVLNTFKTCNALKENRLGFKPYYKWIVLNTKL